MNRRLASIRLAGFAVSVLTGVAIALGNSVSTNPAPAYVRTVDPASADGSDSDSTVTTFNDRGGDRDRTGDGDDDDSTTSTSGPRTTSTSRPSGSTGRT